MDDRPQIDLLRFELRKKEANAKIVPYISFILTHAALVLFLILSFFSDQIIGPTSYSLAIKTGLAVVAVLFLASEWIYAIITSRRWKKDIWLLLQLEEEQRHHEELTKIKQQEEMLASEQLKNRLLQANLQRQRSQAVFQGQHPPAFRSIRPDRVTPSSLHGNNPTYSHQPQNNPQYPFSPQNENSWH